MRKGFLKSVMGLLAGTGMALTQSQTWAGEPFARVSFEDADQSATSAGAVTRKAPSSQPTMISSQGPGCTSGYTSAPAVSDQSDSDDSRIWVSGEYLMWWLKKGGGPALVTRGSATDPLPGALGQPGTTVVVGNPWINDDFHNGGRFTIGTWLDCDRTLGIESSYFFLGRRTDSTSIGTNGAAGTPAITRPFLDVTTGRESGELVALPNALAGTATVTNTSFMQGFETNGVLNWIGDCDLRVDLIGGFRYVDLQEGVGVGENITVLPGIANVLAGGPRFPFLPGNVITVADQISTRNQFYGGQVGAITEFRRGKFFADVVGKFGLGVTHESATLSGISTVTPTAGVATTLPGGLLVGTSNAGHFTRDRFSVLSETGLNVGYQVNCHLRAFVGYTLLYWTNVAQPGNQIDRGLNPARVPTSIAFNPNATPARPAFAFHDSEFWAQGLNFGLEYRW